VVLLLCPQVLKAKQGSSQQYSSQAERDTHLKKHIQKLKQAVAGQQDTLQSLRNQEEELGTALNDLASVRDTSICCMKLLGLRSCLVWSSACSVCCFLAVCSGLCCVT
jgi:hypothetical protein